MELVLIKDKKLYKLRLPSQIYGNYWLDDEDVDNKKRNLINVEEVNGYWQISSNNIIDILVNNNVIPSIQLIENEFYFVKIKNDNIMAILYCLPTYESNYKQLIVNNNCEIILGNGAQNQINYQCNFIANEQLKIIYNDGIWSINNLTDNNMVFYNNEKVQSIDKVDYGKIVFVMGLKIIFIGNTIILSNPKNLVYYNNTFFHEFNPPNMNENYFDDEDNLLYKEDEYFFKSPRFKISSEKFSLTIDSPPVQNSDNEDSILLTLGPSITMGLAYMITGVTTIYNVIVGKEKLQSQLSSIVITISMLLGMIFWPIVLSKVRKGKIRKKKKITKQKYEKYLEEQKVLIDRNIKKQKDALFENYLSLMECFNIINNNHKKLWNREINEDDFLTIRLGLGDETLELGVEFPQKKFSVDDNELDDKLNYLSESYKSLENVPIVLSLVEKNIIGVVDEFSNRNLFINSVILQLITYHDYNNLKIVFFTDVEREKDFEYLKILPHCWNDNKEYRFFASNKDDMKKISNQLMEIYKQRISDGNIKDYMDCIPYYLVIVDNIKDARNLDLIKSILSNEKNNGFSVMFITNMVSDLPSECSTFINIGNKSSGIFENELVANKQKIFENEFNPTIDMYKCSKILSNIPLNGGTKNLINLPKSLGFLEMFEVGKVEQLNSMNRWQNSNPTVSLEAPIGVGSDGDIVKLDLHEKAHGPHGLVAGMTGSGKSEFIITYILSLAVNYHPYEVSFVLIDYKGGGLAGAFENRETKIHLPHLAGTITNLDTAEMKRMLVSIESELKRRQKIFNNARDVSNEGTIDIYKYQQLYRNKVVDKPVPHLFIICDEFAELKSQQPEFMDQLISAARIGRSLGVHLILATQKPSGVVNDQIWSNSRFHVCLKVQSDSDSMELLKKNDAARIKDVGRFYLQVGNDELYVFGQSAYCGGKYIPSDKWKAKFDNAIDFINNTGEVYKKIEFIDKNNKIANLGDELPNIVKYLIAIADKENIKSDRLWLDSIPQFITIDYLKNKYQYNKENFVIDPIIGEYDDPANQYQGLLTLPISNGNTLIYGMSGSGKEMLLSTFIYSSIITYTSYELNFYILDFGAETLRIYKDVPQVGDLVFIDDKEKISKLFKLLIEQMDTRKSLFAEYNGNYNYYCKNSGKTLPNIVVIINNYDAFSENYQDYEDDLNKLTREGVKCGIFFIITSNNINSVRYSMKQNFSQEFVLQIADPTDYITIFGRVDVIPSNYKGRGIVKLDNIYEFQIAHVCPDDELTVTVKNVCQSLIQNNPKAISIPVLPKKVTIEHVKNKMKDLTCIPIGLETESLDIVSYNFKDNFVSLVTYQEIEEVQKFANALVNELKILLTNNLMVFDGLKMINFSGNYNYCNDNFENAIGSIKNKFDEIIKIGGENFKNMNFITIVIIGVSEIKDCLSMDNKKIIEQLMKQVKEINCVNFIVIDSVTSLKQFTYDDWFNTYANKQYAIYVGNGILNQNVISTPGYSRKLEAKIPLNFGYLVNKGDATLIKLIEDIN